MSVQGVRRVAAVTGSVVVWLIVLGGALGPARNGSAQPARLEPDRWYDVVPAAPRSAVKSSYAPGQILTKATSANADNPAGKTVWLAAFGCVAILAAGSLRVLMPALKSSFGAHDIVPPCSPRGENKNA